MEKIRSKFAFSLLFFVIFSLMPVVALFAENTPLEGEKFPDLTLPLPQKVEERNYLMIEQGPFHLSQIKSEVIIVEIFSIYCPHCQKEAANVNALYQAISSKPDLKSRVKLVGIGAGNSAYEVNAFRSLYKIGYPLLPDEDMLIHKKLGEVRTPYFFVIWNKPNAGRTIIYSKVGSFGEPEAFLQMISAKTGGGKS